MTIPGSVGTEHVDPDPAAEAGPGGAPAGAPAVTGRAARGGRRGGEFLRYAVRRLGLFVVELWGAVTLTFFFFRLIPGDPVQTLLLTLERQYGKDSSASQEVIKRYRTEFGLDGNLFEQYLRYMKKLFIDVDMGPSLLAYPTPTQDLILRALPWTIGLLGVSAVLSWVIGMALGALAGWRRGKADAEFATNASIVFGQVPFYFVALILVYVFAYVLGWFPSRSAYDSAFAGTFSLDYVLSVLNHAILPSVSIVGVGVLGWLLSTRMLMVPILGEDFLQFAEAKGLRHRTILMNYAVRNCYLPQVTAFGIGLGFIFSGNVLVEQLFSYPGLGVLLVNSISILDFNTMLGTTIVAIITVLTANLLLDFLLPVLDPRVTYWR
ncbi:ABC transporter permease [Brachybacterium sp. NBEC-018]|uniref:ABC transporter permease n=1 Tax=Brachybacterium sp. NBEC-018 TaxID=2996004 RepID=UPI0021750B70|nr:ABC transporter permease [Brachybacterium sp. NBEC-018]UVY84016.1 ABC transporter permease [Brachybacterium sp. NBEC-018]